MFAELEEPRSLSDPFNLDTAGVATSFVPTDFEGPCKVQLSGRVPTTRVFPDRVNAERAAKFAVGELGGYWKAEVYPAEGEPITESSWDSWAFAC